MHMLSALTLFISPFHLLSILDVWERTLQTIEMHVTIECKSIIMKCRAKYMKYVLEIIN